MPFEFHQAALPEIVLVTPRVFSDERGHFMETFKESDFVAARLPGSFVQDNHSLSAAGTVRGLHYQLPPHAQGKLVRVVAGSAYDVAVDIRKSSSTFGRWIARVLTAENHEMLWIPPGFAHAFLALLDDTQLVYKCTTEYHQPSERAIRFDDPDLAIEWPRIPGVETPLSSAKDAAAPMFCDAEVFE